MHPTWTLRFLEALAHGCTVSEAAHAAKVSSAAAYALKARDADFAAAWATALEDRDDTVDAEIRRRAIDGVEEPVVYQGQLTPVWERTEAGKVLLDDKGEPVQARNKDGSLKWLTINKKSDTLLALMAKRSKRYADRTELTGSDGQALKTEQQIVVVSGVPLNIRKAEDIV